MSGFKVNFSVNNQLATPSIHAAPLAQRPAFGQPGRVFIDTDAPSTGIYRDTGSAWVQIASTSSPEADTLQTVTDRGNTTTRSITVGASSVPVSTVDVRRSTAALNAASDWAITGNNNPTITAGATFGVNYVNAVYGAQALTFAGSATIGNTGINAAGSFINTLGSSGAGTITVTQGSGSVRAISGVSGGVYFNTSAASTFTHVAGIKTIQPINSGGVAATVTNYYGVQIADSTPSSGTISYTNQWGIYQEGANDQNYFAGNVILKNFTGTAVGSLRVKVDGSGYGISVQGTSGTDVTQYNSRSIVLPDGSGNNATIESVGSSGLFRFTSPLYQFRVTSGLTNAIYIPTNGRVLINTTTDAGNYSFQNNGNLYIKGTGGDSNTSILRTLNSANTIIFNVTGSGYTSIGGVEFNRGGNGDIYGSGVDLFFTGYASLENLRLNFYAGVIVNNGSRNDIYFRVKSSGDANLLYTDPANNRVGIGTGTPQAKLHLNGTLRIDGQSSGTAGGASGQHLIINLDGTQYKIALLNP